MAKQSEICARCDRGCDVPCEAMRQLTIIYQETRTREKKQLIHSHAGKIGIVDAEPANDIRLLAQKIISKVPELSHIKDLNIKIGYVRSWERKTKDGKATLGDCRKVNTVYGAYLPYDFVITVYEANIGHLSENQLKILLWHELRHVGVGVDGFIVAPHEIEDFFSIADAHSTRWDQLGAEVADILG